MEMAVVRIDRRRRRRRVRQVVLAEVIPPPSGAGYIILRPIQEDQPAPTEYDDLTSDAEVGVLFRTTPLMRPTRASPMYGNFQHRKPKGSGSDPWHKKYSSWKGWRQEQHYR